MTNREILTYFLTRTAFQKFSQNIETALMKKKQRKGNAVIDEYPISYSIYHFI